MDKKIVVLCFTVLSLAMAGCTQMPTEYRAPAAQSAGLIGSATAVDTPLLQLVAGMRVGMSRTFVDTASGLTSTVMVGSAYFSANGRHCRRFTQHPSNAARPQNKLACESGGGWQEVPVARIIE